MVGNGLSCGVQDLPRVIVSRIQFNFQRLFWGFNGRRSGQCAVGAVDEYVKSFGFHFKVEHAVFIGGKRKVLSGGETSD